MMGGVKISIVLTDNGPSVAVLAQVGVTESRKTM